MSVGDGPDWGPTFSEVHKVPGQSPAKLSVEQLAEQFGFIKRKNTSDLAVAFGAIDTGDDFDPWDWFSDYATEQTEAIATLSSITAAMGTTQAYVGDMQDMVTVPRANLRAWGDFFTPTVDVMSGFVIVGGGTYKNNCLPIFYPEVTSLASTGDIYYTPIVVDRVGTLGDLRWIVGADTSVFSVDFYEVALCGYNPSNGNIEKLWTSGDIKDAEADTTTLAEVSISMGLSGTTTPGQLLFFAHQQIAPGLLQQSRAMAAAPYGGIGRPSGLLLDAACYVAPAYTQGIPSSISLASLDRLNWIIPWGAVSVTTI